MSDDIRLRLAELERRVECLSGVGTVEAVDAARALVKVRKGETLTGWVPVMTHRAFNERSFDFPEIGEQVHVVAPSGELAQAFVALGALYSDAAQPPATETGVAHRVSSNGAVFEFDRNTGVFSVDLTEAGTFQLTIGKMKLVITADGWDCETPDVEFRKV